MGGFFYFKYFVIVNYTKNNQLAELIYLSGNGFGNVNLVCRVVIIDNIKSFLFNCYNQARCLLNILLDINTKDWSVLHLRKLLSEEVLLQQAGKTKQYCRSSIPSSYRYSYRGFGLLSYMISTEIIVINVNFIQDSQGVISIKKPRAMHEVFDNMILESYQFPEILNVTRRTSWRAGALLLSTDASSPSPE